MMGSRLKCVCCPEWKHNVQSAVSPEDNELILTNIHQTFSLVTLVPPTASSVRLTSVHHVFSPHLASRVLFRTHQLHMNVLVLTCLSTQNTFRANIWVDRDVVSGRFIHRLYYFIISSVTSITNISLAVLLVNNHLIYVILICCIICYPHLFEYRDVDPFF